MKFWVLLAVTVTLYHAGSCAVFPYKPCRRCGSTGRCTRSDGRVFGLCWWCGGTGRYRRFGRWLVDAVRAYRRWRARRG